MGYEIQIAVGVVRPGLSATGEEKDHNWFQIYATVDMCKPGHDSALMRASNNSSLDATPVYYFSPMGDGDTTTAVDRYGSALRPIPIQTIIKALREDSMNDNYRRFKWALALLESLANDNTEDMAVVLWGY